MQLFNFKPSTLFTALCSTILTLLGFGCAKNSDEPCMYGVPTGDFEIKGEVTDEAGNKVENAEIRVTFPDDPSGLYSIQTTTTNADGEYIAKERHFPSEQLKVVCIPSDPMLEPDSVKVKMHYTGHSGAWYEGVAKETVNFTLKPKVSEEE